MAGTNSSIIDDLSPLNPASMNIYLNSLNEEFGQSLYSEIECGKAELPNQALFFGNSSNDVLRQPTLYGDSSNDLFLQQVWYGDSSNETSEQAKLFNDLSSDFFSQQMLFGASTSSSIGFSESMDREGLTVPQLVTTCTPLSSMISSSDIHPFLESSSVLSPTSSLDSPVFIPHSSAPQSPTTGKFSFAKENLFKDIPYEIALKPTPESYSSLPTSEDKHEVQSPGVPVKLERPAHSGNTEDGNNCHNQSEFHLQSGACAPSEKKQTNNNPKLDQRMSPFVASDRSPAINDRQSGETELRDPSAVVGVPEDDGYNWRKYGQKQVKGGEYPRSYYKCTHPGCNMKKKVERSSEGDITKIIYSTYHNHPRPNQNCQSCSDQAINGGQDRFGDSMEAVSLPHLGAENHDSLRRNQDGNHLSPYAFGVSSPMSNDEEGGQGSSVSLSFDGKGDETDSRNLDACDSEMGAFTKPTVVIRATSKDDVMDDGYRWRKYGQKVVKGNQNPRSYYKCTNAGCNVRKQIERAKDDINSVITTYEGKHNHDVPVARGSSHPNSAPSSAASKAAPQPRSLLQRNEPTQDGLARLDGRPPALRTFGFAGREPLGVTASFPYTMGRPGSTEPPMVGLRSTATMAMPVVSPIYGYPLSHHQPTEEGGFMMPNVELKKRHLPDAMLPLRNAAPVYPGQFISRFPL